ncbi:MAG: F0F1 ATP synthase subunit delta [Streptosporangiales bacterium]|nr:F0F1 ATP synthase subunit delta [Streptosporangiales bacterium]
MQGVSRTSLAEAKERLDGLVRSDAVDVATLGEELFEVVRVLDAEHVLRRVLADPSSPGDRKAGLARSLLEGRAAEPTLEVVDGLVRARWSRSLDLVDAAEELAVLSEVAHAEREGRLDDLEDELFRFGRIVEAHPRLRSALTDPAAPADRKRRLLADLLEDRATRATLRLVTEVAVHPRGRSLEHGLEEYGRLVAELRRRLVAVVRTAVPLTEAQKNRLAQALASVYGHDVHLHIEVDPDTMGGLSVRIGDEVIDGTIRRRLEAARRRLAG